MIDLHAIQTRVEALIRQAGNKPSLPAVWIQILVCVIDLIRKVADSIYVCVSMTINWCSPPTSRTVLRRSPWRKL